MARAPLWFIIRRAGQAPRRLRPLSSNVRRHSTPLRTTVESMGHSVTALLGSHSVLSELAEREHLHQPVPTKASVWLLPLTEDAIDKVVGLPVGNALPGFNYLYPKLLAKLELASARDWIVYAETEYFGGIGAQGSAAFNHGAIVYGPKAAESACINEALASVGIKVVAPAQDEFETVGLGENRFTEDWLSAGEIGDA